MTFPFNGDSVWIYPFVYFSTAYGGIVAVTTMFSTDSILGFYTTYVCGQLELLHKDISKIIPEGYNHIINSIGSYTNIPSEEKLVQEEYCRRLRLVISRYNVLIKWVLFYIYVTSCIFFLVFIAILSISIYFYESILGCPKIYSNKLVFFGGS